MSAFFPDVGTNIEFIYTISCDYNFHTFHSIGGDNEGLASSERTKLAPLSLSLFSLQHFSIRQTVVVYDG